MTISDSGHADHPDRTQNAPSALEVRTYQWVLLAASLGGVLGLVAYTSNWFG